jgi:hypothetical protein
MDAFTPLLLSREPPPAQPSTPSRQEKAAFLVAFAVPNGWVVIVNPRRRDCFVLSNELKEACGDMNETSGTASRINMIGDHVKGSGNSALRRRIPAPYG